MSHSNPIQCVLFDLDGTLLDTSYDFAYALNLTCQQFNAPPVIYNTLRGIVSEGGQAMIEMAFPDLASKQAQDPEVATELAQRKEVFLQHYFDNIARHTSLFPGLEAGMQALADSKLPWGIITNKPTWLTTALLKQLTLPSPPLSVICGDTLPERKPNPAPMLLAAKECNVLPENCLYLGDHARDIEAGKNANMQTGAALFGYLPPGTSNKGWQADLCFSTPFEISQYLIQLTKPAS